MGRQDMPLCRSMDMPCTCRLPLWPCTLVLPLGCRPTPLWCHLLLPFLLRRRLLAESEAYRGSTDLQVGSRLLELHRSGLHTIGS